MKVLATVSVGLLLTFASAPFTWAAQPVPRPSEDLETKSQRMPNGSNGFSSEEIDPGVAGFGETEQCWCNPCCDCTSCSLRHGLPNPRKSRCDMPQHLPYLAEPRFYYYFRPYNWFHISAQQDDVQAFGGDRRHPYDNRIFQKVYQNLPFDAEDAETVNPPNGRQASVRRTTAETHPVSSKSSAVGASSKRRTASSQHNAGEESSVVRIREVRTQSKK